MGRSQKHDKTMQEQLQEGVIKPIPEQSAGEVIHYIPYQAAIGNEAETTKLPIVYDCSVKENSQQPSLNDLLETGPSFQPLLFNILIRSEMRYLRITDDIKKPFL